MCVDTMRCGGNCPECRERATNPRWGEVDNGERPVSVELMQRVWANLYFNEADAGHTFQATLNEVVDWLAEHDALPSPIGGKIEGGIKIDILGKCLPPLRGGDASE